MRKLIITLAQFCGCLKIAETLNNQRGSDLKSKVEQAIESSNEHARQCGKIAQLQDEAALKVSIKAEKKASKLFAKAERKREKFATKANKASAKGAVKASGLRKSALNTVEAGQKSEKFANNLNKLFV